MMLVTDFYALMGIDLVVCAAFLRLTSLLVPSDMKRKNSAWSVCLSVTLLVGLWSPCGAAGLPLLAFARGIFSDFSVTSVILAVLCIAQLIGIASVVQTGEKAMTYAGLALAALLLYPTALGLGDWDVYRTGWGSAGLLMGLSLVALSCFWMGFRLLPLLIAAALLAWSFGLLESGNLWDYLIDPWIACLSLGVALKAGFGLFRRPVL